MWLYILVLVLKVFLIPFFVSILVGYSVVVRRIYKGFVVFIFHRETLVDLVDLDMVDFDVVLRMD